MKKIISYLLSFVMVLTVVSPFCAYAEDMGIKNTEFKNPLYTGEYEAAGSLCGLTSTSIEKKYNGVTYYGTGKKYYTLAKDKLDSRATSYTMRLYSTQRLHPNSVAEVRKMRERVLDVLTDLFMGATDDQLSVSCYDGDYTRWIFDSMVIDDFTADYTSSSYNLYTFKLSITYNSNKAEEAKVDQVVDTFINTIIGKSYSDLEIMERVHDFICSKTTYENAAVKYPENYRYAFSAYGALVKGRCVCQGYALAFYRICKELGYKVRFVGSDPDSGCHAWNIVMLDNKYYFVDTTWDDELIDMGYTDRGKDYFLKNYSDIQADDNYTHQHLLYDELFDNSYFNNNYRKVFSSESYDGEAENIISNCPINLSKTLYNYSGSANKPSVTVSNSIGEPMANKTDYNVSYSANTNCGRARAVVTGLGDREGLTSTRVFSIRPAKMGKISLKSGTRTSSSLTLSWSKPAGNVSGYQIQTYTNGEWKSLAYINSGSTTTYKISSLTAAKVYKYRIRAFTLLTKMRYYGEVSATYTTCTLPKKVTISSLSTKSKSVTVKWKKVSCTGYEIQYSLKSNMSSPKTVKVASATAQSKVIKSLKKGKRYYFRIRAYKTNGSNIYRSAWSGKKSITVK